MEDNYILEILDELYKKNAKLERRIRRVRAGRIVADLALSLMIFCVYKELKREIEEAKKEETK